MIYILESTEKFTEIKIASAGVTPEEIHLQNCDD